MSLPQAISDYIKCKMDHHHIPGLSLTIRRGGNTLFSRGFGKASLEFDVPATVETVYHLASVTKLFTGTAVMKLVETSQLTLNTPVTDLLPDLPPAWQAIQLRHLLTHTAGLKNPFSHPRWTEFVASREDQAGPAEVVALVAELPLNFPPGREWAYTQTGYVLLGMIVERMTGLSFTDYLKKALFEPLDMVSTTFGDSTIVVKGRNPAAYAYQNNRLMHHLYPYPSWVYPAAGLNSSVVDLERFLAALEANHVLRPESRQALWSPVLLNNGDHHGYGLGWSVGQHHAHLVVGHEGAGSCWMTYFPTERLAIVLLCNLNGCRDDDMQYDLADITLSF